MNKARLLRGASVALIATTMVSQSPALSPPEVGRGIIATFSIVAFDPATGDLGVAVTSKFPAVGKPVKALTIPCSPIAATLYSTGLSTDRKEGRT